MTKKILFRATSQYGYEVAPKPIPAKNGVPEWWKNMPPYMPSYLSPEGKTLIVENTNSNYSPKKCVPMLDAITSGYLITLWADVQVDAVNYEKPRITWKTTLPVFEEHISVQNIGFQIPENYSPSVFKFLNYWTPITPAGYSILVTHPFGHSDIPFRAVDAVIDSDKSTLEFVPPVWVKNGFRGVVEKGTPIAQVIPFKRESWESSFSYETAEEHRILQDKNFNGTILSHYLKKQWSKKSYR